LNFYEKIKKEHLFIFLFILIALILFSYFDFGYTGLAVRDNKLSCTEQGYSCCSLGTGKGTNYFSLDDTCSQEKSCWSYCAVSYDNKNLITGKSIFTDVFDSVSNFFKKLFKPSVGLDLCQPNTCNYIRSTEGRSQKCVLGNWQNCLQFTMCDQSDGECRYIQGSDPSCTVGLYSTCNPNNVQQYCFRYEAPTSNEYQRVWVNCPQGLICGNYGLCQSTTILDPPTDLVAIQSSSNAVRLNWVYGNVGFATGFKVYRSSNGVLFNQIARLDDIAQRSYEDRDLTITFQYYYKVRAFNSNNNAESPDSNIYGPVVIVPGSLCGNGQINSGEQCDGTNLNGQTCQTRGFSGGTLGCSSTCQFDTSQCTGVTPYSLIVTISPEGSGTVTSESTPPQGNQINCPGTCSVSFNANSQVTLIQRPNTNYEFLTWTGDCSGTTSCTVNMNGDKNVNAYFRLIPPSSTFDYSLYVPSVTITQGSTASQTVTITRTAGTAQAVNVAVSTLTLPSGVTLTSSNNRVCTPTSGTLGSCTVTFTYSATTTATLGASDVRYTGTSLGVEPKYGTFALTVAREQSYYVLTYDRLGSSGRVRITPPNLEYPQHFEGTYLPSESVSLVAIPDDGNRFVGWGVDCSGTETCTFTPINSNKRVTATFTGTTVGSGFLRIDSNPRFANIYIDNSATSSGQTPTTLTLSQGTHALKLTKQEYQDYINNNVQITSQQTNNLGVITLNPSSSLCGNGQINSGEQCDGNNNLNGQTCQTRGFSGGTLRCSSTCQFDTSLCTETTLYTLTVTPSGTGSGYVISDDEEINCGGDCTAYYQPGTVTRLTALANPGSTFTGWGNACSGTEACTLTMNSDKIVTATFTGTTGDTTAPLVTINSPAQGSTVSSPVNLSVTTNKASDCKWSLTNQNYASMTNLLSSSNNYLSHTTQISLTNGLKTLYVSCLNRNPNGQASLPVSKSFTVSGIINSYALTVTKTGQGTITSNPEGISCPSDCSENYAANTKVTLTIKAAQGYTISDVIGIGCRVAPPIAGQAITGFVVSTQTCTLTMSSAKTVSVTFSQVTSTGTREICDNNIDDDNDKAIDELDTDCLSSAYVKLEQPISPKYFKSNSIAKQPWEESQIDLRCRISQSGSSIPKAKGCIFAKVGNVNCELKDTNSDENIDFLCDVKELGDKNASCNIYNSCAVSPSFNIRHINYTINVTQPVLCKPIVGEDRIDVSDIELDADDYDIGDLIESTLTVTNVQEDRNADITVSMQLYDINRRKLIDSSNLTKKIEGNSESEDYTLSLRIPSVEESRFKVYYKIFEKDKTSRICLQYKNNLNIEGRSSCQDEDDDGYDEEACGGDDCDDDDESINPGAVEICTDDLDNDCNNLVDDQDPLCSGALCTNGDVRECSKGICAGTQTCSNNQWGQCLGGQQAATEQCNNNLDDDCDGLTDNNDNDCAQADSDNDGLPDSWETQYFGTLNYDENDDPDDDGSTNLEEYDADTDPSDADSHPEKVSILNTIIIVIIVIVAALFLIWWFALKPKKPKFNYGSGIQQASIKKPFIPNYNQSNAVLVDYVKNSLRKGYTKEQIKKALLAKGWKNDEIERAFKK